MERKKRIYRHLKTLEEAGAILRARFGDRRVAPETIAVREALGRILAEPVTALASVPAYHAAAMDGIAVKASDTFGALPERPLLLPRTAGKMVDTGDPIPEGKDAVVMIERVEEREQGWEISEAAYPWRNVRKAGEDIVQGEVILPARHRIRPYDQAALLAAGILSVKVFSKPRVLIIPTGDEIVRPEEAPSPLPKGTLLEVNGQMLASLSVECGAVAEIRRIVPDRPGELKTALTDALAGRYDLVMTIAGSSAGSEDFTPTLLEELGELLVHGITVMPGKPALLAAVNGRPVIGIPGYPVSAAVAFREFARPLLFSLQGLMTPESDQVEVSVGKKIPSKLGLEERVRVILGNVGGKRVAMPIGGGAGVITSLVRADGILRIPQEVSGFAEGETARADLMIPREALNDRLLAIGSHDLTIDLLNSLLKEKTGGRMHISSSNVGSLGGLLALKRQTAHFAGSHLLDTATGEYNLSYIRRYLPEMPVVLITLVHRWQGFITPAANPKRIKGIGDLIRPDIVFVNRQAGSGTRILLDYELARAGIAPDDVVGYRGEEYTHMNVAMAVASGAADVGLGIHAAARALSLDFVPVARERYDLVIPAAYMEDEKIRFLLEIIGSTAFREKALAMGGYEVHETGNVVNQS
ncbi:MAG: molybdopterin biosynthesis protein [Syntrophales bacterium]|nr:molybdopterin biosynthesis protein [Syntrophales bacterium]